MVKTKRSQVFLTCLSKLLASQPYFCFGCLVAILVVSLIDSLAIGGAVSMAKKVAIGLSSVLFVKGVNELSKVLNCRDWLLSILIFQISFL